MEILIYLFVGGIIIYMLSNLKNDIKKDMRILNKNMLHLKHQIEGNPSPEKSIKTEVPLAQKPTVNPVTYKPLEVSGQRILTEKVPEPIKKLSQKPVEPIVEKVSTIPPINKGKVEREEKKSIPEKVVKDPNRPKRDYEKVIGENWLNKIGIAILVIGVGFFVKYAIDKEWINEVGRVGIGLIAGGILIGIAHYLHKKYRAFSSVLIGGGISIFYYTISIAYHDYSIFSQSTAFVIMIVITLLSTIASIFYDRKELAIIALIGGFTSPFMVQNGDGNYIVFFTYIAIINSGMLLLSYFKKWDIILKLSLAFTVIFFGAWMIQTNLHIQKPALWSIIFSSVFFLQFLGAIITFNFVRRIKFKAWELVQIAGVTALYYGAVMYSLNAFKFELTPSSFTIIMSGFFALLAALSILRKGSDQALTYILIGKAIAFTTLTGALLFDGFYMTKFWAVEAVIILALGKITNLKILKSASVIIMITSIFGLMRDWMTGYLINPDQYIPSYGTIFVTGIFVVVSLIISYFLIRKEDDHKDYMVHTREYIMTIGALAFFMTYLVILIELIHQLNTTNYDSGMYLILWIYHFIVIGAGLLIARIQKSELLNQIFFFSSIIGIFFYLMFGQMNNFKILNDTLFSGTGNVHYYLHYALTALIIGLMIYLTKLANSLFQSDNSRKGLIALFSIIGLIISTVEMEQLLTHAYTGIYDYHIVINHIRTEGYTILWGVYSFIIMLIGMRKSNRITRILALLIFCVALLKLFIFDIREISEAGKIIAFISLGILLLVISFMYQKLKNLIVG